MGYIKCSHNYILYCNSDHRCQVKILSSKSREKILKIRGKKKLLNILHCLIKWSSSIMPSFPEIKMSLNVIFTFLCFFVLWNKLLCTKSLLPAVLSFVSQQGQSCGAGHFQGPLCDVRVPGAQKASPYCQVLPKPKVSLDNRQWIWSIMEPYSWKTSWEAIQSIPLHVTGLSTAMSFLTDVFFSHLLLKAFNEGDVTLCLLFWAK